MSKQQMDYMSEVVLKHVLIFNRKRQQNKFLAFGIKLTSAALSAVIVILLGLTVSVERKAVFANIALILSAVITLLNTWDAFFNHKALWLRFTVACQSLRSIQEELDYLRAKTQGEPTTEQVDSIHRKFKRVMLTVDRDWENLRKEEQGPENT